MSNLKTQHFVLCSITIGKKLNFSYQYDSANLDNKVDEYTYGSYEEWHPDFADTVTDAIRYYAEKLGFKPDDWAAFEPTKIFVKGVLLKIDFTLTNKEGREMSVTGGYQEGLGELTQQITGEALSYINGSKRKQGDLFDRTDVIYGERPKKDEEDEEEPLDLQNEEFMDEELEPAIA